MKVRLVTVATVALAGLLAPSAMGATVIPLQGPCVREGQQPRFAGVGFQPGQVVAASLDGQQLVVGPADGLGRVLVTVTGLGSIARSEQTRSLSLTQTTNPAITGTAAFRQTRLYVVTKPSRFRPGSRLRVRAGGFFGAGKTLYAHVRGPKRRNLRIGRVTGPCGKVSATKKALLKRGDRPGFYTVQFDTVKRYVGARAGLRFRRAYTIRRIFRFSRSSSFSSPVLGGGPRAKLVPGGG